MPSGYQVYRSRGTPTALLYFTYGGEGFFRHIRAGREHVHVTRAGELALWEPHAEQEYGTVPGSTWDFHWVHFFPRDHWRTWLQLPAVIGIPGLRVARVEPSDARSLAKLWNALERDARLDTPWRREMAMNALERILLQVRERAGDKSARPLDERVQAAMERIAADPVRHHDVASLARTVGLSPSRFAHLFSEQTGASVIETVLRARLQQAERLLSLTPTRVSEIAFATGFGSVQHFSRHFSRRYGMSPRAFRERAQARPT